MKFLTRFGILAMTLALGLVVMPFKPVVAQSNDTQASIIVSIASVEEQLKDVNYLSDAAGFGRLGGMLISGQADEYLKGVRRDKPIGLFIQIKEDNPEEPTVVGMVPVSDYDEMLDTLSMAGELDDSGDIDVVAMGTGESLYLFERDGMAVMSNEKSALDWAPSDLNGTLGDLPKNYNVAFKIFPNRIPKSLRQEAIDSIRDGYQRQLEQSGTDGGDLQKKSFEMQMAQMESLINETKELTIGFSANKEAKAIYFDFEIVGLENSKLAQSARAQADLPKSRFAGFKQKGALATVLSSSKILGDDIESTKKLLAGVKQQVMDEMDMSNASEKEAAAVTGFVDTLFGVMNETIEGGVTDGGLVVMGGESPSLALGFTAVNASKLDKNLRELAEMANESGEVKVDVNAETLNGVKLHRASIAIPDSEEEMQALFGNELVAYIGVDDKTVYMAAGDDCFNLLKKCANAEGASTDRAMELEIYLSQVLALISSMEGEQMMEEMAAMLKESGKDRISIWSKTIKNGATARFEIQDGVLKLISLGMEQFGGMGF